MSEEEPRAALKFLDAQWLWNSFWVLRGALAAFLVLTLLDGAALLPLRDVLQFVHTLITGWDVLAHEIGLLIGRIPFVPELHHLTITALGFVSVVIAPASYALAKQMKLRTGRPIFSISFGLLSFVVYSVVTIGIFHAIPRLVAGPPLDAKATAGVFHIVFSALLVWLLALTKLKGYWRGFVQFLVVIVLFELLYYSPIIGEWMRAFSNFVAEQKMSN